MTDEHDDDQFRGRARFQGGARFGAPPTGGEPDAPAAEQGPAAGTEQGTDPGAVNTGYAPSTGFARSTGYTPSTSYTPSPGGTGYTPTYGTTGYTPSYGTTGYTPSYGTTGDAPFSTDAYPAPSNLAAPPNLTAPANPYVDLGDPGATSTDARTTPPPSTIDPSGFAGATGVDPATVTSGPAEDTRVALGRIEPKRVEITRVAPPPDRAGGERVVVRMPPPSERVHPSVQRRNRRRGRRAVAVIGVLAVLVIAVMVGVRLLTGGSPGGIFDSRPNVDGTAEDFDTRWQVTADGLLPGAGEFLPVDSADWYEYAAPYLIPATDSWIALVTDGTASWTSGDDIPAANVVAFDPVTGALRWQAPLPGGLCSERLADDDRLVCVGRDDADGWAITVFAAADGEVVLTVPIDIEQPWNVHLSSAGLLVVTESTPGRFTMLNLFSVADGTRTWSHDLADLGSEELFREEDDTGVDRVLPNLPIWRDVGDQTLLTAQGREAVHIDPATGDLTLYSCWGLAVVDDTFACERTEGTTRYEADGTEMWFAENVGLERSAFMPAVGFVNTAIPGTVLATDWATGGVGDPLLAYSLPQGTNVSGTAEHTFFNTESELTLLSADGGSVRWTTEFANLNSITTVVVVDDVAIVSGSISFGLDLTSGEVLWSRDTNGDISVIDGQAVSHDYYGFALLELPEG